MAKPANWPRMAQRGGECLGKVSGPDSLVTQVGPARALVWSCAPETGVLLSQLGQLLVEDGHYPVRLKIRFSFSAQPEILLQFERALVRR